MLINFLITIRYVLQVNNSFIPIYYILDNGLML